VTYPIFAVRETLRRIYTVIKSRKPDGVFCVHTSCAMPAPIMSWATSHWTGEDLEAYGIAGDETSLPFFRLKCMTTEWGVPAEFLHYTQWGTSFEGYLKGNAFSLLHDVLTRAHNTAYDSYEAIKLESKLWRLSDEFGRKEAEWLPYWSNGDYVTAGSKGAFVSLYKHPTNGVLAVISNLSRAGATVEVQLNLDKLGLPADASAKDALTENPVVVQSGRIGIELPSLGWMIVWLK
jgi:hypothetical protein